MDKDTLFSSFGKWVAPIFSTTFLDQLAQNHADAYVKKLTVPAYLKLFLHAQLQQREGLRSIADDVLSKDFQQELGFESISFSQLCRKNNQVNPALLENLFEQLARKVLRSEGATAADRKTVQVIDSTTISLCLQRYKWAEFRQTKAGIKIHLRLAFMGKESVLPERATITTAKKNDRTQMDALIDEEGATYLFDRGYVDYKAFDDYTERGIHFVTRLKNNAVIEPLESFPIPMESRVTMDERVRIGSASKRAKREYRMIETADSEGNLLILVTNRFELTCDEISDMYRSRWAIETFFKWMKQHLRIKRFYGTSERAVQNQVWMALIAYCLLVLVKKKTQTPHSLLMLSRWLRVLLWKPAEQWLRRIHRPPSRKSAGRRRLNST
ncbi:IS4 family transposase [Paenibacillus herberti]|uniref:IS4 family transposase n=1 Tax=Paenibacillus herberti TaxID=1619309 RepID=A0A229NUZ7_9BACL|nr:IS4 family transposase [Paenibacillus herberti]OXM13302.1 IS4 family transposase [Paenibacillus herberti]OXM13698.1 IS4 family transposase [Paenibacillus herberti]OXM14459.1 IS4 family transposase [Paenibacillus herberti]OXM16731.1 IS4 family transposase [Paenibacillus herberti]OXM17006.1 IS4 family transposase [Paenibacillus herberti]